MYICLSVCLYQPMPFTFTLLLCVAQQYLMHLCTVPNFIAMSVLHLDVIGGSSRGNATYSTANVLR